MQRIQASGAVARRPRRVERAQAPGYFSSGDPSIGQQATLVTADFLNDVQEEIIGAIEGAGLKPTAENCGQLLAAIGVLAKKAVDALPSASTSAAGLVQLSDAVDSDSHTTAASSSAVKALNSSKVDAAEAMKSAHMILWQDSSSVSIDDLRTEGVYWMDYFRDTTLGKWPSEALNYGSYMLEVCRLGEDGCIQRLTLAPFPDTPQTFDTYIRFISPKDPNPGGWRAAGQVAAHAAMPSDRRESVSVGASGMTYTSMSDGYVSCTGVVSGASGYVQLVVGTHVGTFSSAGQGLGVRAFMPCKKGDPVRFFYNGVKEPVLNFSFAEGSR